MGMLVDCGLSQVHRYIITASIERDLSMLVSKAGICQSKQS